ncbi:MAG: GNAT family N-acetyltransferase [Pseudomonadota bacterium]
MVEPFTWRVATRDDIPSILALMDAAIVENMKGFLDEAGVAAARETMGLDTTLIDDGTYFLVLPVEPDPTRSDIAGCGGWSWRSTLYGGDQVAGRDDTKVDPTDGAARIRAMYTHPSWTRCGVGTYLLTLGENAARDAGYSWIELGSTEAGEPLYRARGYEPFDYHRNTGANGVPNLVTLMRKAL